MTPIQLLLVEDSEDDAILLLRELHQAIPDIHHLRVDTLEQFDSALRGQRWDIVISDYRLGQFTALEALEKLQNTRRDIPFIVVSGAVGEDVAVTTIKAGASDYIMKDSLTRLASAVDRELRDAVRRDEHRRADEALRQSEERFSKVFKASPVGISISRLSDGRFVEVNDAFLKVFGYRRDELIGFNSFELNMWVDPQQRQRLIARLCRKGSIKEFETKFRTKAGELGDSIISCELIDLNQELHALTLLHDVTERKALEAKLIQSQKMESIGQLAGGIAHDFNNILTVIQGQASLLLAQGQMNPECSESVRDIAWAADRAAKLTRQLLLFSRRQLLQPKILNLHTVVGGMTKMLERILGEDLSLQIRTSPDIPTIKADAGMMEQIILNLAVNARDAMPQGGHLSIEMAEVDIIGNAASFGPEAKAGRFVCLSVSDTGCGIPPENLSRIFDPFFTTKEIGKGTGLGLATIYGIVKQHNGWIKVKSEIGSGTQFQIFLPAMDAPVPAVAKIPRSSMQGGSETILVVEDEEALRSLVAMILRRNGYTVMEAASGVDAWEVWKQHRADIDLVLTDLVMPKGLNGRDLAAQLHAEKPSLKVIFTSGYSAEFLKEGSMLQEGINFLQKPYTCERLLQLVHMCLHS
jgi:two-component system, cell cycle sensor histidine kinase and response regulator CckA